MNGKMEEYELPLPKHLLGILGTGSNSSMFGNRYQAASTT